MTTSKHVEVEETVVQINAAEYPIASVTVFQSGTAEIVRSFSLELQPGQTKIEISGLSSSMHTDSVRVSGLGDARLCDVVVSTDHHAKPNAADSEYERSLLSLNEQRTSLRTAQSTRREEAELLKSYAKTIQGQHISPTDMLTFLEKLVQKNRERQEEIEGLEREIKEIDATIEDLVAKKSKRVGPTGVQIDVVIGLDVAGTIELKLTYIVNSVSWKPFYELHAKTEKELPSSSVSLQYRARVKQSTGEDWTQTALTLSTVTSDSSNTAIPEPRPLKLVRTGSRLVNESRNGPTQKPAQRERVRARSAINSHALAHYSATSPRYSPASPQYSPTRSSYSSDTSAAVPCAVVESSYGFRGTNPSAPPPSAPPPVIMVPATIVSETPVAASYSVEGKSTIPSDAKGHQVSIANLPFDAQISHITVPRIEPRVYLECEVKNTSEYRLLAGPVSVILNDSYVSRSSINNINAGDSFSCTLGSDSSVKVTYIQSSRTENTAGSAFVEALTTTTHTSRITVFNTHPFPLASLVVRDVIPTSEDKNIKVILRNPRQLATAKDGESVDLGESDEAKRDLFVGWVKAVGGKGGEKEGRFEWKWKVGNGEKVVLEAEWDIQTLADIVFGEVST